MVKPPSKQQKKQTAQYLTICRHRCQRFCPLLFKQKNKVRNCNFAPYYHVPFRFNRLIAEQRLNLFVLKSSIVDTDIIDFAIEILIIF